MGEGGEGHQASIAYPKGMPLSLLYSDSLHFVGYYCNWLEFFQVPKTNKQMTCSNVYIHVIHSVLLRNYLKGCVDSHFNFLNCQNYMEKFLDEYKFYHDGSVCFDNI